MKNLNNKAKLKQIVNFYRTTAVVPAKIIKIMILMATLTGEEVIWRKVYSICNSLVSTLRISKEIWNIFQIVGFISKQSRLHQYCKKYDKIFSLFFLEVWMFEMLILMSQNFTFLLHKFFNILFFWMNEFHSIEKLVSNVMHLYHTSVQWPIYETEQ